MNHNSASPAVDDAAEGLNLDAFLQQAVDHYPRLAVFSFTVWLSHSETIDDNRALITRFYTEVWQRIGEYSWQRQQARRHSPPTILRWIWESASTQDCKMVLLMNLDTLGAVRNEGALQVMSKLLCEAWLTASEVHCGITDIMSIIVNRSYSGTAMMPFHQLKAQIRLMVTPVLIARTGVTCY
ncbi:inovirus Gp2 family protein [Salmonella enterica]|nr:inovirus Gp2 family protein [Salmonella enterica]ECT6519577.1 inovirus Gp2 family protein [Salmonella enterica]EDX8942224.1 inovirus Gp2 family protein [Salmonella enterica subsp. enterica serovar Aba]EIY0670647.1 inovirus-type Gp2 protein [Salmonella enterica]